MDIGTPQTHENKVKNSMMRVSTFCKVLEDISWLDKWTCPKMELAIY